MIQTCGVRWKSPVFASEAVLALSPKSCVGVRVKTRVEKDGFKVRNERQT